MATDATLIGRRPELEAIGAVVDAARAGRSGALVVRGPPGVGKTALLDHAAAAAATGFRVLRADGVEGETELAFAGLHQLLRPLTSLLERLPLPQRAALEVAFGMTAGEGGDRFAAAAATLNVLAEAADERPVLCVVDDLQWIDRPSADALVFAARRLDAEPVALLLALRDGEPPATGLARLPALALSGLARDDARELLERSARLAPAERERVLDVAEGNPLALLELPGGPLAAGPAPDASMSAVERSFAERVGALDERAVRAVLLAAADDDPHAATALRALPIAGLTVADLAAAETTGLVWLAGDRLAFRHPLVRSAAYGRATFAERRDAHAALAEALSGPADADRRAWHRAAAATAPDAAVAADLAGSAERARARGGHAAAAVALERAARLTEEDGLRARRFVEAADAARLAGDVDRAVALADEAGAVAADDETAAEAAVIRGAIRVHRGVPDHSEEDLTRAARVLAPLQPQRAARTALLAAEAAALGGHHGRAAELARWIASLPTVDADAERAVVAFADGMAHLFAGRPADAHPRLVRGAELAARAGDPQVLIWTAAGLYYAGDMVAARRGFAQAVSAARDRGALGNVAFALPCVANLDLILGRFAIARSDAAEGLALVHESGEDSAGAYCHALLGWDAAVRGREDDCRAHAAEALDRAATQPARVAVESAHRALALLDLGLGRHDAACDRLASVVGEPGGHPARRLLVVGDLVEAAVGCGRSQAAEGPLAQLTAWARATGSAWAAATVAGAAVQLAEDADAAEAAFAGALEAHAAIELPFDRARLQLRLGEALRRARRRTDARRHLRAALDVFAHAGATPWEQRAANELRATGETARKREASTLDDLTPQEVQIARLVAEGTTNRDIAGRLFLSPRTVEYHLAKVFRKLGVSSRTQLAGLDW